MLLAWVIDEYKKCLDKPVFQQELGMFYAVLENIHYDDMQAAHSFYNAVITLFQSQVLHRFYLCVVYFNTFRINIAMALEVKQRVIMPIRNQLGDFIELQTLRQKYPDQHAHIPVLDASSAQMIELIIYQISYALQKLADWDEQTSTKS